MSERSSPQATPTEKDVSERKDPKQLIETENSVKEVDTCTVLNKDPEVLKNNDIDKPIAVSDRSKQRYAARKERIRHAKKRKWKPYCKLTFDERKKVEERDSKRAFKFREKMSASGLTLAPYNTTQFLMEDHNLQEPDYDSIHNHGNKSKESCHSYDSEDFYSSPDDEDNFLRQQFSETYDSYHDAYINNMSKFDLVREVMRLEDEIELHEQSLRENRDHKKPENPEMDIDAEFEKIKVFKDEISKLDQENRMLEKSNEDLQNQLSEEKLA